MRLVATLTEEKLGRQLSEYLRSQDIDNILEVSTPRNWGEASYGSVAYTVWVIEEQNLAKALEIAHAFAQDSANPRFQEKSSKVYSLIPPPEEVESAPPERLISAAKSERSKPSKKLEPLGKVTTYLLMACTLLFFFTASQAPNSPLDTAKTLVQNALPVQPLYFSPLKKQLLFDYPQAYEIVDEIIAETQDEPLDPSKPLPAKVQPLAQQYRNTPYWKGFYDKIVAFFQHSTADWQISAPLFEKARQGELWRFISPVFLHADIFHLLFNMLWLAVLGKQIENRLGTARFILFIALAAIVTNSAQYFMTGSNFIGFSGVICAMITFVWMRQRQAPWEGYLLQVSTFNFALLFLFAILLLQLASFYTEISFSQAIAPQIANTAHMTGLLLGLLAGNLNYFAWKHL